MDRKIQIGLDCMHIYLMNMKFPYHSVSVIHNSSGFKVYFMDDVKEMVTDQVKDYLKRNEFTYSFVKGITTPS